MCSEETETTIVTVQKIPFIQDNRHLIVDIQARKLFRGLCNDSY